VADEPLDSPGLQWSPGAVARMLGVAPATLRTWDRRYGLGPSTRESGKHRRYDADDVARLRRMLELTGQGVAPASAAAEALGENAPSKIRDGGGRRVVAVSGGGAEARGFARAAIRLDAPLMSKLATDLIAKHGVVRSWDDVLMPFLVALGERTTEQEAGVEVEHLATSSIITVLRQTGDPAEQGRLPALLACAPEEQHSLPLEVLRAALAERGCPSRNIGARVPVNALLDAAALLSPATVLIWAHTPEHASLAPLGELAGHTGTILLGGAGWLGMRLPEGARVVSSLSEAISAVLELSGRNTDTAAG
jgi:hypothetical protein